MHPQGLERRSSSGDPAVALGVVEQAEVAVELLTPREVEGADGEVAECQRLVEDDGVLPGVGGEQEAEDGGEDGEQGVSSASARARRTRAGSARPRADGWRRAAIRGGPGGWGSSSLPSSTRGRRGAGAVWQVLPVFVARRLWRLWEKVDLALQETRVEREARKGRPRGRSGVAARA